MLKRLYIDNYKCFSNFEYRPGQVELLVGANGSGKSSLFSVLMNLTMLSNGSPVRERFEQKTTRWDTRRLQTFELEVEVPPFEEPLTYRLEIDHRGDDRVPHVQREVVQAGGATLYEYSDGHVVLADGRERGEISFPADDVRSPLAMLGPGRGNGPIAALWDWIRQVQVLQLVPQRMDGESSGEEAFLQTSGENYASWLRTLLQESPEVRDGLKSSLAELWPGFAEIKFERAGTRAWYLKVGVAPAPGGRPCSYNFWELSDGEKALIAVYTVYHAMIAASSPGRLLCIDEPAAYLALREVQPMVAACYDDFEEIGQQLLIASHHPEVINFLAPNKAVVLQRHEGGPTRVEPFPTDAGGLLTPAEVVAEGLLDE